MCDPVTISAAVMITGQVMQGYAAKQQGEFQDDVAKYNARQLENEATRTRNRGIEEENRLREETAQLASRQQTQLAASGVDLDIGSAFNIQEDTRIMGEADALRIRSNFGDQARALEDQSGIVRAEGKAAKRAGEAAFYGSLLSAGGTLAGKWYTPNSSMNTTSNTLNQGGLSNTTTLSYR